MRTAAKRLAVLAALIAFGAGCGPRGSNGQDQPTPHVCESVSASTHHDVPCQWDPIPNVVGVAPTANP